MVTGILGGTFDPPHRAHLGLAQAALATGEIDRVLLVPAKSPPHKQRPDMLPAATRLEMTRLLAESDPRLSVSDMELCREGDSYSVLTIRELIEHNPEERFRLIIGADMALIFGTWYAAEEIIKLAPPLIAARPGYVFPDGFGDTFPEELSANDRRKLADGIFPMPQQDVSSTQIRDAINSTEAEALLTPLLLDYIRAHGLYE